MKKKLAVLVLFGGVSSEHEVSCASAESVLNNMDSEKYDIYTVGITKEGNWLLTGSTAVNIGDGSWKDKGDNKPVTISMDMRNKGILVREESGEYRPVHIDVVFPVLHGKNGEDGTMQGFLQIAGLPYVGPDTTASSASMDKAITKSMVEQAGGVNQAYATVVRKKVYEENRERELAGICEYFNDTFPLFVKPANAGSSVGISKVKSREELPEALNLAFNEDDKVVIEEAIIGREIEVAVLGNKEPKASCIGEIFAANEFYDYNAKYENEESKTAIVDDLDHEKELEVRNTAVKVFEIMGCCGLSRVDFFIKESGKVIFNEINTLPGFTSISMYPQLWEASGIPYEQLIDELIDLALN